MWSIEYKGFYIHGYCDDYKVKVNFIDTKQIIGFKSLHSAKLGITRHINLN